MQYAKKIVLLKW